MKALLEKFGLTSTVLCYVKDKGNNLETMTTTLKSTISYEALNLPIPFARACFGHAMSKVAQYVTIDDKVFKDLKVVNIKSTQIITSRLQHMA